jgi:hypothetical protein
MAQQAFEEIVPPSLAFSAGLYIIATIRNGGCSWSAFHAVAVLERIFKFFLWILCYSIGSEADVSQITPLEVSINQFFQFFKIFCALLSS